MQIQQEINVLHSFREFNVDDGEVCDYIYELMDGDGVCFLYIDLYQWYADMQLDSIRRRFNHECFDVDVWESLCFGFLIMDDYRQGGDTVTPFFMQSCVAKPEKFRGWVKLIEASCQSWLHCA